MDMCIALFEYIYDLDDNDRDYCKLDNCQNIIKKLKSICPKPFSESQIEHLIGVLK